MLEIPQRGFRRSSATPNVDNNVLADWLEANILFEPPEVGKGDVVDMLVEYQICPDERQDIAHEIAAAGWNELVRRRRSGGLPPSVSINEMRVAMENSWKETPIWSFFVLLSTLRNYPEWARQHESHVVQGDLFERVVEALCPAMLPGWTTYRAGWSPNGAKSIHEIVEDLCERLYVAGAQDLDAWITTGGGDGGLDIVCYRRFQDEREALPMFFLQCASGKNWRTKVDTPDGKYWQKLLNSAVEPATGIVAPFVIEDKELRMAGLKGQVVVFDRLRVMSAACAATVTLDEDFLGELFDWMEPRVGALPRTT